MDVDTNRGFDKEILTIYIAETKEQIARLVFILLQIEQQPYKQREFIDEMFCLAHNFNNRSIP